MVRFELWILCIVFGPIAALQAGVSPVSSEFRSAWDSGAVVAPAYRKQWKSSGQFSPKRRPLAQVVPSPEAKPADNPAAPATGAGPKPAAGSPEELKKKADGTKKDSTAKEGAADQKPTPPPVVTRPQKPESAPDPRELELRPDETGRVRFNFSHQPWPAVLEWLARVSQLSLDWQELPADYLNLQTQRDYSLEEARDLINRHLLVRGFTLLKSDEVLTVVNLSKLNAALVPRVEPDELASHMGAEFVKVSFPLKWLLAERAVEELKPMLSPNGKLHALKEINRVEAMDAVENLQDIHRLLQQSQTGDETQATVVKVFHLQHRRAAEVVLLVESILGLEPKRMPLNMGRGSGGDMMSFQIMNQLQQMQQQMQQQGQRSGQGNSADPKQPEPRLIVNDHENSILAHATPDKLEIISETIAAIDVPPDSEQHLLQTINRVKPYRLSTADPQPIMAILKEMGNLSPQSRLQIDEKSRSLILYGTLADHYTTQSLIERLDGTNRNFEVLPLRRLQADAVAGTIQYLLGAEDEDKNKNSSNRYSWMGYSQPSPSRSDKEERPFRVDADLTNNRLLVWANDVELQEVRNLLVKMGETPPGMSNPETRRTIELPSEEEATELLKQLDLFWPQKGTHPLRIESVPAAKSPEHQSPQTQATPRAADPATAFTADQQHGKSTIPVQLTWWQSGTGEGAAVAAGDLQTAPAADDRRGLAASPSAITIQQLPDGRIVYSSADTEALDRLEELMSELASPLKDFHIFQLKYPTTWAYGIEIILKDFFEDESRTESTYDPWWGTTKTTRSSGSHRLSRQKELKIISDEDSHTILVQGATPEQLKVISELIEVYDRRAANDPQAVRKTEIFRLQYSQAPVIAEAVKQVYRDLLSANDPALQNPNQQKPSDEPKFTYIYGRQNSDDKSEENPAQPIKFKGLLSVGVDEVSNTVIVSSTEGLMRDIRLLIQQLDEAARPTHAVQVMQVRNINPEVIQQRLQHSFSSPAIRSSQTGQKNRPRDNESSKPENSPGKNGAGNANATPGNGAANVSSP